MKRIVIVFAVAVLMFCLSVWALGWGRQMTGHLIVTCIDKETGGPITNATVTVKTLNCLGPNAGVYESHYTKTSGMTDSNGVADVEFQFLVPDFEWEISTPSHYSWAVGIPDECFDAEIEPSDYEDIDELTPEGAEKAQQIRTLHESEDWLSLFRLLQPKSITCTNAVIRRSLSLMPKHNPQPMYVYWKSDEIKLPGIPVVSETNGVRTTVFQDALIDLKNARCVRQLKNNEHDDVGAVVDFTIESYCIESNGVEEVGGCMRFDSGCGFYKRTVTGDESFPSAYEADTNALFQSIISYRTLRDASSRKVLFAENVAQANEYLVLRTRPVTNDNGQIVSWNYSKIQGPIRFSSCFKFGSAVFNPRPNDPNLEPGENLAHHH